MADEHDWQARQVGGDALVQRPQIVYAFTPAVPLGKKSKSSGVDAVRPWTVPATCVARKPCPVSVPLSK